MSAHRGWTELGTRGRVLREMLNTTVPLRMAELRDQDPEDLLDWLRRTHGTEDMSTLLPYVDALMYGDNREHITQSRRALVDGLAVLALLADGGVTLLDLHFCTDHAYCLRVRAEVEAHFTEEKAS